MKFLLVVAALAQAAYCGNVGLRASNILAPAGVTYVDGSYHAGLAAGPVAYSGQQVYQSAPAVAVAAAPVAYAAPAAKYAAVPTVEHVPGVADVPVTRIDAQPTVIQKTVDIARPALKTQRYEVRRPAIQKQFYDIEERVVVRPAGSAVVELEEPLSRTQKGPSVIRPTGDGVAVSSSAVAVPAAPAVAAVSPAPAELPSVEINLARASLPAPVPAAVGIARGSIPVPAVPSVGIARSSIAVASAPSVEVRSSIPSVSPAPIPSVGLARSSLAVAAPAAIPSVELARSSVSVSPSLEGRASVPSVSPAPFGLARSGFAVPGPVQSVSYSAPGSVQSVSYPAPFASHTLGISAVPVKTVSVSAPIHTVSGVTSVSSGVSGISSVSAGPSEIAVSTPAPQYEQQIVQSTPAPPLSDDDSVSIDSADVSLARSSGLSRTYTGPQTFVASSPTPTQETIFRSEIPTRRFTGHAAATARGSLLVNYPNPVDLIPQSRFRATAAPVNEDQFQFQINHENQQKLIQLLTARGGVTEVGLGRSGPASYPVDAGQVRARVLSATPAPAYAAPAGERVNTRRVVVSRPVETLQEVEVAEPVTKFERVRVDQPAVVKTASQEVVRVPTSVPVYGKALAPIAEAAAPVAAYSADWH